MRKNRKKIILKLVADYNFKDKEKKRRVSLHLVPAVERTN
jgi:hypothetical protein